MSAGHPQEGSERRWRGNVSAIRRVDGVPTESWYVTVFIGGGRPEGLYEGNGISLVHGAPDDARAALRAQPGGDDEERERLAKLCDDRERQAWYLVEETGPQPLRDEFKAEAADWRTIAAILRTPRGAADVERLAAEIFVAQKEAMLRQRVSMDDARERAARSLGASGESEGTRDPADHNAALSDAIDAGYRPTEGEERGA